MSNAPHSSDKKKRASKRYSYQRAGKTEVAGEACEAKILNISTTGLQFSSKIRIETKNPICIKWSDSKFGIFDPTFLIVREIYQPESKEFCYIYGAQYCGLSDEIKKKLLELLKSFKEEASNEISAGDEKITPKYLFNVIEQGAPFLKQQIVQKISSNYFRSLLADVPDYEKKSFETENENSTWIQKLATHHFHCNILISLIPVVVDSIDQISPLLNAADREMNNITQTENEVEKQLKKISENQLEDEAKMTLQKRFNESSNRLFYSKQSLLQKISQTFSDHVFDVSQKKVYEKLNQTYEAMVALTASFQEEAVTYSRKTKKPEEFSKVDVIADVPAFEETKPRYYLFFMSFILVLILSGVGFYYYDLEHQRKKIEQAVGIDIKILNFEKIGTQLNLVFSLSEWKKIPKDTKKNIYEKVSLYLSNQKGIRSVLLTDDAGTVILVLDKNFPHTAN
jgi:hypothetical protein